MRMTKTPPKTLLTFISETNRIIWVVELGIWCPLLVILRTARVKTLKKEQKEICYSERYFY